MTAETNGRVLWWREPTVVSTIVIAFATMINLVISTGMWATTRDNTTLTRSIFEASNRPYVGVERYSPNKDEVNKRFSINVDFKNFGTVPAREMEVNWDIKVDGRSSDNWGVEDKPYVLFPSVSGKLFGIVFGDRFTAVVNGTSVLEVIVEIRYKGATEKKYYYREVSHYDKDLDRFVTVSGTSD